MRKIIPAFVAIAALAVPATSLANSAPASQKATPSDGFTVSGVNESGWVGSIQGNGTSTQQYSASYFDPTFNGLITCNGVHQIKKNQPTQDSFTCTLSGANAHWTNVPAIGTPYSWISDWSIVQDQSPLSGTMNVTSIQTDATGAVTGYSGVATY